MSNIENLLSRRQEGTITEEELKELNQLTHCDRVLRAATQQAKIIRHRRYVCLSGFLSVVVVAVIVFATSPAPNTAVPSGLMAVQTKVSDNRIVRSDVESVQPLRPAADIDPIAVDTVCLDVQPKADMPVHAASLSLEEEITIAIQDEKNIVEEAEPMAIPTSEPIVACNTQCSPDSVINDIWKFLHT